MSNDDAIREAHRNYYDDKFFNSLPYLDCKDSRQVFRAGFDRGWSAAREDVARFLKDEETIEQCLERNRRDIDTLMRMLDEEKKKSESLSKGGAA